MGYFPSDIPFMSEEERKENGIKIPKDPEKAIDVYIYKLDLNVEKPAIEKIPGQIRIGSYDYEVIRWIGPNEYRVWESEFDTCMLGVVNEPLENVVELIVGRDDQDLNITRKIQNYLDSRVFPVRKRLDILYRGYGALSAYIVKEIKNKRKQQEHRDREAAGCKGCKHVGLWENEYENGLTCPCLRCSRRTPDNYEPERRNDD